ALLLLCITAISPSGWIEAATFTVTDTTDDIADGKSLRWAIDQAKQNGPGHDTINFNILGVGPHAIQLTSTLIIKTPVTVDGYTEGTFQLGANVKASANSLAKGNDAVLKIVLDGTNIAGQPGTPPFNSGLELRSPGITIRGLAIINAPGHGIAIFQQAANDWTTIQHSSTSSFSDSKLYSFWCRKYIHKELLPHSHSLV
ncbi:MAG: hypothetical protein O7C75_17970, partial [Verrucomicrobia bacterium]|nr:hypothetical protein [Verrucomicrobiota bacterium]